MLMTPPEAADFLRVNVKTLAKWRHERRGPVYRKIEGAIRYERSALESFGA